MLLFTVTWLFIGGKKAESMGQGLPTYPAVVLISRLSYESVLNSGHKCIVALEKGMFQTEENESRPQG
jgi:hypothetical protein